MELKTLSNKKVEINQVEIENEAFYKISNSDQMRPFFMSMVSDSNHWMFISSNGGLTAGRKNSDYSIFPYYTDDKITESSEITGSKSIFRVQLGGETKLWEPFSIRQFGEYNCTRNLYKSLYGNKIIFEEENHDLGLIFRYRWSSSNKFGFVRRSYLYNTSSNELNVKFIDGIQNIVPYGVKADTQNASSNLVDAYKRSELEESVGLGIYALSSIIVDRAEPSEALKANIVWSAGLDHPTYLLSSLQLNDFRQNSPIHQETDVKAEKGAYFVSDEISLGVQEEKQWMMVANVNQDAAGVAEITEKLKSGNIYKDVLEDIELGNKQLLALVSASDGIELSADKRRNARHFSNTLFNIMRGGIFDMNYQIEKWDFDRYLQSANKIAYKDFKEEINSLNDIFNLQDLREIADGSRNPDFKRLALEYMPLKFSRRHGDPSRPWNRFSINTRDENDGSKILDYEGNWRDIFQNWEALAYAYPEFIDSMIHKFLNASTFDGYNPYRVTKGGIDWEVIEEHDPWSYIGYWGDHQIIYLQKFLEIIKDHYPERLASYFTKDIFVYANVPYKIKPYDQILLNPKDTILFDYELDEQINKEREIIGADAALIKNQSKDIHRVNFIEKILATSLAKMSNFIPEAGIWMNTQRPEWNDANNALVGNGVSMVTLCYMRRFFNFFSGLIQSSEPRELEVSEELLTFFNQICKALDKHKQSLEASFSGKQKRSLVDDLGLAGSAYRNKIYNSSFSGKKEMLKWDDFSEFVNLTLKYLDHTINANLRHDGMYHAYNLMKLDESGDVVISYLDEMLEGQVAALSSTYLNSNQALAVLDGMKNSALFRPDQYSYLLYPNKDLPGFLERNNVDEQLVQSSELLSKLIDDGNAQLIVKDINGKYHFNGNFNNAGSVKSALDKLEKQGYADLVRKDRKKVLDIFEKVFNHIAFTGRSGTFYGYEGLGSIYWHMVSKLLLAVQECCLKAIQEDVSEQIVGRLLEHYYEIYEGIGVHKSPELYGAFPTDPYSHTPAGKGAQQPGMTGQVKEDILSRIGELGVFVKEGNIHFDPRLLKADEFLSQERTMRFTDVRQQTKELKLGENSLGFTHCQVPVIYQISDERGIEINFTDGSTGAFKDKALDADASSKVFKRTAEIESIKVFIDQNQLK